MKTNQLTKGSLLALIVGTLMGLPVNGQQLKKTFSDWISEDAIAAAVIHPEQVNFDSDLWDTLVSNVDAKWFQEELEVQRQLFRALAEANVTRVGVVLRTQDLGAGGPCIVLDGESPALTRQFKEWWERYWGQKYQVREAPGGWTVLALTNDQLETFIASPQRKDAAELILPLKENTAGVMWFGNADSRRVVKELFPKLPAPFESLDGELLGEQTRRIYLQIHTNQAFNISLSWELPQDRLATAHHLMRAGIHWALNQPSTSQWISEDARQMLAGEIVNTPNPGKLDYSINLAPNVKSLSKSVGVILNRWSAEYSQRKELENLRELALAILNFDSAHGQLPVNFEADEDPQQPRLSWRVRVLPFLDAECSALYQEFHLDEPWDSPHNRKLIQKMPRLFQDFHPDGMANNLAGKTRLLAPSAEGCGFTKEDGVLGWGDITDGTSNTLMLVTVAPDQAVEWTRPADWEVDLNEPTRGLVVPGRPSVTAATFDSAIHQIRLDLPTATWQTLLQRADGKIARDWAP